jgi:hypothetical protein
LKGQSRFLFGQRLSDVNPPLAGEVDEARVYLRALAADEVAASFRAGPASVSAEELAAVLTPEQSEQLTALKVEQSRVHEQLTALQPTGGDPWSAALADARSNNANPLHVWRQFTTDEPDQSAEVLRERWSKLTDFWRSEMTTRREFNQTQFAPLWDLRGEQQREWFPSGTGLDSAEVGKAERVAASEQATPNGEFSIEADGDRVVRGIHPAGVFTHGLSSRHTGVLLSPRFLITTDSISVRAMGQNSMVRLVIENYPIGNGGVFPATPLARDELGWLRLDTAYRKGSHGHFEFSTNAAERAFFGAAQIVASHQVEPPRETTAPIVSLLQDDSPSSTDELALRYVDRLQHAVRAWQAQSLSDDETAFLDFFLRRNLLPTTLAALPQLRESVERYRQLEREIPIPRATHATRSTSAASRVIAVWSRPVRNFAKRPITVGRTDGVGAEPADRACDGESVVATPVWKRHRRDG